MASIKARRLLSDLFLEGTEVRFGKKDGANWGKVGPFVDERGRRIKPADDVIAMFIRSPDPVQRDMAMRAGQAKRAAALVRAKRETESEEHLTIMAFLVDMSQEALIDYVIMGDVATRRNEAEREILALDEWKDMTSYQDMMRAFEDMDPEELEGNEDYQVMLDLDEKYTRQVSERELELMDAQVDVLRMLSREQLERKALEKRSDLVGSQAFIHEYEKQMRFYSVRDVDNPDKLFFENPTELAAQPDLVQETITEALLPYIADAGEAKNSSRAASGSDSSEPPAKQETSEASTPEAVSA